MDLRVRRRVFGAFSFIVIINLLILILWACTSDFGIEADFFKGTVKGKLHITTVVPEKTDEIRVALSKSFPPSNINEILFSEVLPVVISDTVTSQIVPYDMQVPLGEYAAAFCMWKEKAKSWRITDIVGVFGNLSTFEFKKVVLTEEDPVAEDVDMDVNLDRVNRNAQITGHIEFVGEWPINTAAAALLAFKTLNLTEGLPEIALLPRNVESFDYQLGINADSSATTIKLVAVGWLAEGANLLDFKILGFYHDPDTPEVPKEVVIKAGETVSGIDIIADFANAK